MANHWIEQFAERILAQNPGPHTIAIGKSPSGVIHIGFLRELLIADGVYRALKEKDVDVKFLLVVDDFDPLRKVPRGLSEELTQYYTESLGKPIANIKAPDGKSENFSEYHLKPLLEVLPLLGVECEVVRASEMYKDGSYTGSVNIAIEKKEEIARILTEESGRDLPENWEPVSYICKETGHIKTDNIKSYDVENHLIHYITESGKEESINYAAGEAKLPWRIDWAARWLHQKVTVEPFGKDHAGAGGSFSTGCRLSKEIFKYAPPAPIPYEWIELKGHGPMSSSKGIVVAIEELVTALPPEIVRYLIFRSKPNKHISFDPGMGILQMIEQYEKMTIAPDAEEDMSLHLSKVNPKDSIKVDPVPFRHLMTLIRICDNDPERLKPALERAGYADKLDQWDTIWEKAQIAWKWSETFLNPEEKLTLQKELPISPSSLTEEEKAFLSALKEFLSAPHTADEIHDGIYAKAQENNLEPKIGFKIIYNLFLGQDRGPKAGWFIQSLDPEWVLTRISEALGE